MDVTATALRRRRHHPLHDQVANTGAMRDPGRTLNVTDTPAANATYVAGFNHPNRPQRQHVPIGRWRATTFPLDESGYTYSQALPPGQSFTITLM